MFCTVRIIDVEEIISKWRWVPIPPWRIYKEFLIGHTCLAFGIFTGPFPFVGRVDDKWVVFRSPPQLVREGSLGAYYVEEDPIHVVRFTFSTK